MSEQHQLRTLGDRIMHSRMFHPAGRMSQRTLARVAGCSVHAISRIELGYVQNPNSDLVRRLSDALGVTTDWLLKGEERASATESTPASIADAPMPLFGAAE